MEIIKIVAIGIISTILIAILKHQKPDFGLIVSIIAGVIILGIIFSRIDEILNLINSFSTKAGIDSNFVAIILKITGIAYMTEFGVNICKDSGESALASKVELGGKVSIMIISIPVLMSLLDILISIMP